MRSTNPGKCLLICVCRTHHFPTVVTKVFLLKLKGRERFRNVSNWPSKIPIHEYFRSNRFRFQYCIIACSIRYRQPNRDPKSARCEYIFKWYTIHSLFSTHTPYGSTTLTSIQQRTQLIIPILLLHTLI